MSMKQFGSALLRYWAIILICTVGIGAGTYLKSKSTTPTYQASALVQVSVGSGSTNLDDLLASSQLMQTEVVLATSTPILQHVAAQFPGVSADDLVSTVTVSAKTNALVFEINVQNSSPTRAAALANAIAQTLINQQTSLQKKSVRNDKVPPAQFLFLAQPAQPPRGYILPNPKLYGELGLAAGLLLGILLAVLFDCIDPRIRTVKALLQEVSWPMLTSLRRSKKKEFLTDPSWQSANAEGYNTLLTRLVSLSVKNPLRFLLVTSPTAGNGKSTVAANLAISMARTGQKTLLIDANLRAPILHERFDLPAEKAGLTNAVLALTASTSSSLDYASQSASNQPPVTPTSLDPYMHNVGIPHLRVMPSGPLPPNPAELLSSKGMDLFYQALVKSEAEVIIFDTNALLGLSDTNGLLTRADATLLVVDIAHLYKRHLAEVKTLLTQENVNVLGCVVSRLKGRDAKRSSKINKRRKSTRSNAGLVSIESSEPSAVTVTANSSEEPVKTN